MSTDQPVSVFDVRPNLEQAFSRINKLLSLLEVLGRSPPHHRRHRMRTIASDDLLLNVLLEREGRGPADPTSK